MVISMADFGQALITRVAGRMAYDQIFPKVISAAEVVTFDFSGVDSITNSFADEVFGRMALTMGMDAMRARTTFKNISPMWARVIRGAINARLAQNTAMAR